jgi:hypothetical protein
MAAASAVADNKTKGFISSSLPKLCAREGFCLHLRARQLSIFVTAVAINPGKGAAAFLGVNMGNSLTPWRKSLSSLDRADIRGPALIMAHVGM